MSDRLLTVEQASALLGISVRTVYLWAETGRLPYIRLGGRTLRFDAARLLEWANGQAVEPSLG